MLKRVHFFNVELNIPYKQFTFFCQFTEQIFNFLIKDTHREKAPPNKTPGVIKSTNMGIWDVGIPNKLFIRVLKLKQNLQKNKAVAANTPFFFIGPFCTHHSICLNTGFWQSSLNGNDVFSVLVLSTKKRFFSFLKKVFVFQKICFKVNVLKTFKISTDCHIKTCRSRKQKAILKIPIVPFFRRTYALSIAFKMKLLRKSVFQC